VAKILSLYVMASQLGDVDLTAVQQKEMQPIHKSAACISKPCYGTHHGRNVNYFLFIQTGGKEMHTLTSVVV
jgi:hypothetical protein